MKTKNLFSSLFILCVLFPVFSYASDFKPRKPQSFSKPGNMQTPYIDTHNHLFGGRKFEEDYFSAAKTAMKKMDRLGIQKMLIMPPPISPGRPLLSMEDIIPVVRKYPDRFAMLGGGGELNVMIHKTKEKDHIGPDLKNRFRKKALKALSNGAIGFGELAVEHFSFNNNHPYESVAADHPLFLLLSDIAGEKGVPVDIHMEAIPEEMPMPGSKFLNRSNNNPKKLKENIPAFERLLEHNRRAKIIWAHVGWCNTGQRTPDLCRRLFEKHPNLYMSFKLSPESMRNTRPIRRDRKSIRPEWLQLIRDFPDRFVIGTDQFYSAPGSRQIGPQKTEATRMLMNLLPPDLAQKIGMDNPKRLFGF